MSAYSHAEHRFFFGVVVLVAILGFGAPAEARETIVIAAPTDPATVLNKYLNLAAAHVMNDPTQVSLAVHDALVAPGDVRLFSFTATTTEVMPIEVFVPVRRDTSNFRPVVALIYWVGGQGSPTTLPFKLPYNFAAVVSQVPADDRPTVFEPWTFERLYHGERILVSVQAGQRYYLAVYEPNNQTGDYVLMAGTKDSAAAISAISYAKNIARVTLGIVGGRRIPWRDFLGLCLMFAGLVVGLGSLLVAATVGLLGRKTALWPSILMRAMVVTEPLHILGLSLFVLGGLTFFWQVGAGGLPLIIAVLAAAVAADIFLMHFYAYPVFARYEHTGGRRVPASVRYPIILTFFIGFFAWFFALMLLIWYLLM